LQQRSGKSSTNAESVSGRLIEMMNAAITLRRDVPLFFAHNSQTTRLIRDLIMAKALLIYVASIGKAHLGGARRAL